jgi:hypothetical protein
MTRAARLHARRALAAAAPDQMAPTTPPPLHQASRLIRKLAPRLGACCPARLRVVARRSGAARAWHALRTSAPHTHLALRRSVRRLYSTQVFEDARATARRGASAYCGRPGRELRVARQAELATECPGARSWTTGRRLAGSRQPAPRDSASLLQLLPSYRVSCMNSVVHCRAASYTWYDIEYDSVPSNCASGAIHRSHPQPAASGCHAPRWDATPTDLVQLSPCIDDNAWRWPNCQTARHCSGTRSGLRGTSKVRSLLVHAAHVGPNQRLSSVSPPRTQEMRKGTHCRSGGWLRLRHPPQRLLLTILRVLQRAPNERRAR